MTEQTPTLNAEQIAKAKAEARTAAEKRLRDSHPEEFRAFMVEEHAARGVEYTPRLTPAERARKEIERLAQEHGISLALDVETIQDGDVEVNGAEPIVVTESEDPTLYQRLRSAAEAAGTVPAGTPVVDADASPEERRAQAQATIGY